MSLLVIGVLAIASVIPLASAQIDDRARVLLEGIQAGTEQLMETMDQSMVMTTYLPDGTSLEMRSRTVIDFVNRRLITVTEPVEGTIEGTPSMVMVYKDGEVTMTMSDTDAALPVPPGITESLEASFDQPASTSLADIDGATYDGEVDYDVLKGEQVTLTTILPGTGEPVRVSFVFQDGKLVGTHAVADGQEVLSVFDAPVSSFVAGTIDNTSYILEDGVWTKISHMHFEVLKFNEPIDESLFD